MRVHLRITPPDAEELQFLFETLDRKLPSVRSLGFSLSVHLAIAWVLAMISFPQPHVLAKSRPPNDPTEIRIGDRLYYVARIAPPEPARAQARRVTAPKKAPARAAENPKPPAETVAEVKEPTPVPRAFIPPEYKRDPLAEQTLIQPDSAPNIRPKDLDVPSFRIWSAEVPKIPKPFVAPGQRLQPVENPQLLAQPTFDLNRPGRQVNLTPHLTLPPPAPLDLPPAPENPQLTAGDPVNILSLSNRPALPDNVLVVPPGNVVAESKPGAPSAGSSAAATPAPPTAQPAGEGASDAKPPSIKAASASGESSGDTKPSSPAKAAGASAAASGAGSALNSTATTAVKQTVIIRPATGNFDAVVVQSSPLDLFPEGRNLLSGRPVYTVYIAVGTAKDWPMYFCVAGEKPPDAGGASGVVILNSPPPVGAPYPTRIVRPEISLPKYEKYVLLHAILNEGGRFRELRVVNAGAPQTDQAIIAAIEGWEFRPASRDGVPVAVEILLAIPAAGL